MDFSKKFIFQPLLGLFRGKGEGSNEESDDNQQHPVIIDLTKSEASSDNEGKEGGKKGDGDKREGNISNIRPQANLSLAELSSKSLPERLAASAERLKSGERNSGPLESTEEYTNGIVARSNNDPLVAAIVRRRKHEGGDNGDSKKKKSDQPWFDCLPERLAASAERLKSGELNSGPLESTEEYTNGIVARSNNDPLVAAIVRRRKHEGGDNGDSKKKKSGQLNPYEGYHQPWLDKGCDLWVKVDNTTVWLADHLHLSSYRQYFADGTTSEIAWFQGAKKENAAGCIYRAIYLAFEEYRKIDWKGGVENRVNTTHGPILKNIIAVSLYHFAEAFGGGNRKKYFNVKTTTLATLKEKSPIIFEKSAVYPLMKMILGVVVGFDNFDGVITEENIMGTVIDNVYSHFAECVKPPGVYSKEYIKETVEGMEEMEGTEEKEKICKGKTMYLPYLVAFLRLKDPKLRKRHFPNVLNDEQRHVLAGEKDLQKNNIWVSATAKLWK